MQPLVAAHQSCERLSVLGVHQETCSSSSRASVRSQEDMPLVVVQSRPPGRTRNPSSDMEPWLHTEPPACADHVEPLHFSYKSKVNPSNIKHSNISWIEDSFTRSLIKGILGKEEESHGFVPLMDADGYDNHEHTCFDGYGNQENACLDFHSSGIQQEPVGSGHTSKAKMEPGLQLKALERRQLPVASTLEISQKPCILEPFPDLPPFEKLVHIVHKCRASKSLASARHMHACICNYGLESNCSVGNHIVPMFVDCGSVSDAQQAFNRLSDQNEHSWTSLISGYIQGGQMGHAFNLYTKMQENSVYPSPHTLMALLKACAGMRDVDGGQEVHAEIARKGFEKALSIGNALVSMYAKCGFLFEAHEVFDKLPVQDVASWTTLISGYVEHGYGQEALKCFEQMKLEGVSPNAYTFSCALKACSSIDAVDKGQEIHTEIRQKGFESDLFVGSTLVGLYSKCGLLSEAWEVFEKLPVRDVMLWTTLIAGFAEHEQGQDALDCFEEMQLEGIFPTAVTFACALKACGSTGTLDRGRELHIEIEQKGFQRDPSVANSLISMYAKCGSLAEAQEVFDKLRARDVVSWNALITGYSEHGPGQQAVDCFEEMLQMGHSPNAVTFACVLKACGSIGAIDKGQEIHRLLRQSAFETDMLVCNTLVGMYAKCGCVTEAQEVFDKLPSRSIVSWNVLIAGYAGHGSNPEALECFHQMQHEQAVPDNATFPCVLKACGSIGALDMGREIHAEITMKGLSRDPSVCKSVISMYAKCGSLSEAQVVFDKLPVRDAVAWSLMIKCFGMNHKGNMAIQWFEEMQEQGVKPDAITFTCLLTACSHASLVLEGKEYFKVMREKFGTIPGIQHYNCMVNLISRSGHLYEAEKFLEMLCSTSEEMWAAILSACKTYGEVELGLRCFEQLVQINAEDSAWYVLMADLYASAGRWSDAYRIEELRKHAGAKKKAAVALIEVNKKVHEFVVGDEQNEEMLSMLNEMTSCMKKKGHLPHLDLVLKPVSDREKETALCEHAEKLAIAFGLLNTPQGTTLRVSKNLRMCIDCHSTSKIISKIERREIILRDSSCIHHFKDNMCSCGDMF